MDAKAFVDVQARMPLAEAALSIWRFVFDAKRLARLWEEHRGRCYEKTISFATMTPSRGGCFVAVRRQRASPFRKEYRIGTTADQLSGSLRQTGAIAHRGQQGTVARGNRGIARDLPALCVAETSDQLERLRCRGDRWQND